MVFANHLQKSQIFFIILFHKSIAQFILLCMFVISNQNKMENLIAKVQTKSNYRNLNGKWVTIIQFLGTIVYCKTTDEAGNEVTFDLNINEIQEIIS